MDIALDWDIEAKTWDQSWDEISGGEAQRLSLAIALALDPDVLMLDEPTSSCDKAGALKIEQTLVERNATVLMVSHSDEQLERFCTSTIELSE
jgi:ATPase subunit of ABC transporter with duplicated ATPase domains